MRNSIKIIVHCAYSIFLDEFEDDDDDQMGKTLEDFPIVLLEPAGNILQYLCFDGAVDHKTQC